MRNYICNIIFLAVIAIGCSPKSENQSFDNLPNKQYTYQPRNEDRELVTVSADNFDIKNVTGLDKAQLNNTAWISDSVGIFKLAENSLLMGDMVSGVEKTEYKKFGHDLLRLFYQSKENVTQFDASQTLYLSAALGFEGQRIKGLLGDVATPENVKKIEDVFASHKIAWPDLKPNKPTRPVDFVRSIRDYLVETSTLFTKKGVSEAFVKSFTSQVNNDYVQALNKGEARLKDSDENSKLKSNAILIHEVIEMLKFIPEDAVKNLKKNLIKAREYAELIEPNHASGGSQVERQVKVISNIWLDLDAAQRERYIKPRAKDLYEAMLGFSDTMIKWLAGRVKLAPGDSEYWIGWAPKRIFISRLEKNCHPEAHGFLTQWVKMNDIQRTQFKNTEREYFDVFSRYSTNEINSDILPKYSELEFETSYTGGIINRFRDDLTGICLTKIQGTLDQAVNIYLLTELDNQIRTWGPMIEKIVRDTTLLNLREISDAMASQDKFTDYFAKKAYPLMNNKIFGGDTLGGIENSKVQIFVDNRNELTTRRVNPGVFETGAETLGVSLAAQYRRILELPSYEKKPANGKEYYKVIFSQINKMLSMIGFRTYDHKLIQSLHRNIYGDIAELDVYKYDCNVERKNKQQEKKDRYNQALREKRSPSPDDYVDIREDCNGYEDYIKNMYQIPDQLYVSGAFTPGGYRKKSSVRAQSEVIRGAALMLNYFSDWRGPNDFDAGLGKETFNEEIAVFPKHAFVNLAVAASTAPIRGLQRENSPIKLFNALGQEMKNWTAEGLPDPNNIDPNLSAEEKARKQVVQAAIVDLLEDGPSNTIKAEDMAYFMLAIDEFLMATEGIEKTHASVLNPPDKTVKENMENIIKGRRLLKMMMFAMANFLTSRMQDQDGGFWSQYVLENNGTQAGSIKKDIPRSLEVQTSVIKSLLAVYKHWGGEGALVAAVESYYFMNQKLWNPVTSFYKVSEGSNGAEVKPYLFLEATMNFGRIAPYLNNANSQAQAKRMFDYYSKEFLKWNETLRPMMLQ